MRAVSANWSEGHATLSAVAEAMLAARDDTVEQMAEAAKSACDLAGPRRRRGPAVMSTPGVGAIVALTYVSAIDDPARFRSSKAVGAHFGLTPKKYQSGETDVTGRISKIGDAGVRTALYEAANVILTRPVKGSTLKSWGMRLAARAGMRKAKVALARKLAVVLHRMLADGTSSLADKAAAATHRKGEITSSGDQRHQPPGARSRRRDDGSGQAANTAEQLEDDCASLDWPTDPHQTPSGGGPAPTPDRSKTPATGSRLERD